jgi:hypothetical protein
MASAVGTGTSVAKNAAMDGVGVGAGRGRRRRRHHRRAPRPAVTTVAITASTARSHPWESSGSVASAGASGSRGGAIAPVAPLCPRAFAPDGGGDSIASSIRNTSRICRTRVRRSASVSRGSVQPASSDRANIRLATRWDVARFPRRAGGVAFNGVPCDARRVSREIDVADLRREVPAYRWN